MSRPKDCLYPYCEKCIYSDCCYEDIEYDEITRQNRFDKELEIVEPEIKSRRISQSIYAKTDKGIARYKRYIRSDKGKEMLKRKQKKKIESGKNSEYCRRYYQKMKIKKLLAEK